MPTFTVKIKDVVVNADSPKLAAMRSAETIAMMGTIDMFTVVDENGTEHDIVLNPDEIDTLTTEAQIKKDSI